MYAKIISTIVLSFISILVNYFLNNKKFSNGFKICLIVVVIINIMFYLLDYYLFHSLFEDYLASSLLLSFLLSITFEDIKTKMMDMRVIIGYFIVFFIYRVVFFDLAIFLEGLIGFALSLVVLMIAYFVKRDSIGIGDIAAISTCGMIIGFPNIFHFLFKAFLFVFIYGMFLIISKKKNTMSEIPLAPFLLLATII